MQGQPGFFDIDERLKRLSDLGDQLEAFAGAVDFEIFRADLVKALAYSDDREAMGHVATTQGIKGEDIRDLMVSAVEHRFGRVNRLPTTIEWLTDNGSCYLAGETWRFARHIGLEPLTTPIESPQSYGMAEAFVRTFKRDYVRVSPCPDARTVIAQLPKGFEHYKTVHPHSALGYRAPCEFINERSTREALSET